MFLQQKQLDEHRKQQHLMPQRRTLASESLRNICLMLLKRNICSLLLKL